MKATELIVGDWVYYKYSAPAPWEPRKWQIVAFENGLIELADPDIACKPIPLTAEILEKNGFTFNAVYQVYELHHFGQHIRVDYENDIACGLSVNITDKEAINTSEVNITRGRGIYVHELQHTLRLCGLDRLADNFKV